MWRTSFNGYEALRQMLSNCQPQARNRTMNLLQGIMAYPSFNMKGSLLPQILKLEEHFLQYDRLGGSKLSSDMKSAVLLRAVTGQMKVHLNLTLNEGSSYTKIREAILAFDTATTKWNESAALSFNLSPIQPASDQGGPMPMEIDRVQQKGKDKGKGKSKESKGKSKGKDDKGKSKGKSFVAQKGGTKDGKGKGGKDQKGWKRKRQWRRCLLDMWKNGSPVQRLLEGETD